MRPAPGVRARSRARDQHMVPLLVREGGALVCRDCVMYPRCFGYATSADPDSSGPQQMRDHLAEHLSPLGVVA